MKTTSPAEIDAAILQSLRKRALRMATNDPYLFHHAEDFASYAVLKAIEGVRHEGIYLKYLSVEYKREVFGDTRLASGALRAKTKLMGFRKPPGNKKTPETEKQKIQRYSDLLFEIGIKKGLHRLIFFLYFMDGYNQCEIADRLGMHFTSVCKIITNIEKDLKVKNESSKEEIIEN